MPGLEPLNYRAFISYSHADTNWARWLHRGLESFRIDKDLAGRETSTGTIPEALRPIFRDRDEFSAGKSLTEQTLAALEASHALIVICSPASARSAYVNEETRLFKSRHPERPVIPLIVDGKPGDPERECFPPALGFKVGADGQITTEPEELLAADAREEGDGRNLALAKVIAGLLDVPSDEIFRRAERERRAAARRKRRVRVLVGSLALLLVLGSVAWLKQDELIERYYWHASMGPKVLSDTEERALGAGDEFAECDSGCPTMIVVPAGAFMMGAPDDAEENLNSLHPRATQRPRHKVTIAKPVAVSKFEVTYDEWEACVAHGDCDPRFKDPGEAQGHPVIDVTWGDAKRYVAWLSRMTGKTYRLLSEAEWEYAARAGTQTTYSWGDDAGEGNAHCDGCNGSGPAGWTTKVGLHEPNAFGLYDMHGNALEWVEDCVGDYEDTPADGSAWTESVCGSRVLRGGAWYTSPEELGSSQRFWDTPHIQHDGTGIRVARTLNQ